MGQVSTKYRERASSLQDAGIGVSQLLRLLDSIKSCSQCDDLHEAVGVVVRETCSILQCDRATVFIVDNIREELYIAKPKSSSAPDIRIPWDAGLAGHVFQKGVLLNIADAYTDERFNSDTDKKTGYKTKSIMCCPIRDAQDQIVAVMQCINKLKKGDEGASSKAGDVVAFSEIDEVIMDHLQSQVGVILRNSVTKEALRNEHSKVGALLDIVRSLNAGMGTASLVFTITNRTPALVNAHRCTLYMVDKGREEIWSMQGAVEIRLPMDKGIAGSVVTSGKTLNIPDAYQDERFNQEYDKKSGYRTKSILCMPLYSSKQSVIGVIQLINKMDGSKRGFTEEDERLLAGFLDIAGSILEQSQVFQRQKVQISEMDKIKGVSAKSKSLASETKAMGGLTIAEGDEEDEDEDEEDSSF